MKRYQQCNWLEKLWRRRWYLAVPFMTIFKTVTKERIYEDEEVDGKLVHTDHYITYGYKNWYRICIGIAQTKMKYYYTHDEVKQHFEEWKQERNEKI